MADFFANIDVVLVLMKKLNDFLLHILRKLICANNLFDSQQNNNEGSEIDTSRNAWTDFK